MIKEMLIAIVILLGIPTGYLVAWLCRDELVEGRNWFKAIIFVAILIGIVMAIIGEYIILWTMLFIIIVTFVSLLKSRDRKWTKRRI